MPKTSLGLFLRALARPFPLGLLSRRVILGNYQPLVSFMRGLLLPVQLRTRRGVGHFHSLITGAGMRDRNERGRLALFVRDEELEIVTLEERYVCYGRRVVVYTA